MKRIPINRGKYWAMVDDEDFDILSCIRWQISRSGERAYAIHKTRKSDRSNVAYLMHRLIMRTKDGEVIDHINGDGLDNRKENLRFATHSQNLANTGRSKVNTSGYKGVHLAGGHFRHKPWRAVIQCKNKKVYFATVQKI